LTSPSAGEKKKSKKSKKKSKTGEDTDKDEPEKEATPPSLGGTPPRKISTPLTNIAGGGKIKPQDTYEHALPSKPVDPTEELHEFGHPADLNTFKGLVEIERQRIRLYKWAGAFASVVNKRASFRDRKLTLNGSMIRMVAGDHMVWFVVALFFLVRCSILLELNVKAMNDEGYESMFVFINQSNISKAGALLSFFLTFFTMESYSRDKAQWSAWMNSCTAVLDIAILVRTSLPAPEAKRIMRTMMAAHCVGVVAITDCAYGNANFFSQFNTIYKLLTTSEMARIQQIGVNRDAYNELTCWVMGMMREAQDAGYLDPPGAAQLTSILSTFRLNIKHLFDYHDGPIPYVYINFSQFISLIFLPLFAYAGAVNIREGQGSLISDGRGGIIFFFFMDWLFVFLTAFFVQGLQRLARQLQNPFSQDFEDMSVMRDLVLEIRYVRSMLHASCPPIDEKIEKNLDDLQPAGGPGFEHAKGGPEYRPRFGW